MTPTRRRAAEFARLLDAPLAPPVDSPVATLVTLARGLPAPRVAPAPEFRTALRTRLEAVAAVGPTAPPDRPRPIGRVWRARPRRLAFAAGALAGVVAVAGLWTASSRSLPGDPLYGLKRATESVEVTLAGSDLERGARQLDFARARLREVDRLTAQGGHADQVVATLADMDRATRAGSRLLLSTFTDDRQVNGLRLLENFTADQQQRLSAVLPALPQPARPRASASMLLLTEVGSQIDSLLETALCAAPCRPAQTRGSGAGEGAVKAGQPGSATTGAPGVAATPTAGSSAPGGIGGVPPTGADQGSAATPGTTGHSSGVATPAAPTDPLSGILGPLGDLLGHPLTQPSAAPSGTPGPGTSPDSPLLPPLPLPTGALSSLLGQ